MRLAPIQKPLESLKTESCWTPSEMLLKGIAMNTLLKLKTALVSLSLTLTLQACGGSGSGPKSTIKNFNVLKQAVAKNTDLNTSVGQNGVTWDQNEPWCYINPNSTVNEWYVQCDLNVTHGFDPGDLDVTYTATQTSEISSRTNEEGCTEKSLNATYSIACEYWEGQDTYFQDRDHIDYGEHFIYPTHSLCDQVPATVTLTVIEVDCEASK